MEKVDVLDDLLRCLLIPAVIESGPDEKCTSLDDVLSLVAKTVYEKIDADPALLWVKCALESNEGFINASPTPSWRFAALCLQILSLLRDVLENAQENAKKFDSSSANCESVPKKNPNQPLLSVQQQKTIETCLQVIVGFGLCPYLLQGVGIPITRRSSHGIVAVAKSCSMSNGEQQCLLLSTRTLLKCAGNSTLGTIIISKHLGDLFAALFQLCFLPRSKVPDRPLLREQLDGLIHKCYQPLVVRELLLLKGVPDGNPQNCSHRRSAAPPWLHKALKPILCQLVMRKDGVLATIIGILDVSNSVGSVYESLDSSDWKKVEAVAKLLVTNPLEVERKEEYYEAVCPQIYALLVDKQTQNGTYLSWIASRASIILASTDPNVAQMYIFSRLMRPLTFCCSEGIVDGVFYSEDETSFCIETLHKIFTSGPKLPAKLYSLLTPVVCPMFKMFDFTRTGFSHTKKCLEELLLSYFKNISEDFALSIIRSLAFGEAAANLLNSWNPNVKQDYGPNGGVEITSQRAEMLKDTLEEDAQRIDSIIYLLQALHRDKLSVKFFFSLLEDLSHTVGSMDDFEENLDASATSSLQLLYIEEQNARKERFLWRSLIVLQLLSAFCEDQLLQAAITSDGVAIVDLIKATLERISVVCSQQDLEMLMMQSESVTLTIGIATLLVTPDATKEVYDALKSCLPALDNLGKLHPNESIKAMALELGIAIRTHGATSCGKRNIASLEKSIERIDVQDTPVVTDKAIPDISRFQEAWDNYCDPLLPVQGHGILALSKLIRARDPETIAHKEKLLEIFQKCLDHEDSYIYLMAIQGLVALTDAFPDDIVNILASEYANFNTLSRKVDKSPELRMKLGEALMKMPQLLGEMLPKYRDNLMNAFLSTARDPDPLIRASSLSNIGEICKCLQFSLSTYICEIFTCLNSCVKYDDSVEVRRAAVLVITLLLRGLGNNAFQVVGDTLKDLYRILKHVYIVDKDDVVKVHVQLALEELDLIMKGFLFPKQSLSKKINVLHQD